MHIKAEEISQIIRDQIKDFDKKVAMEEVGTVISAGDGIAATKSKILIKRLLWRKLAP